jgi:hypothetical protein
MVDEKIVGKGPDAGERDLWSVGIAESGERAADDCALAIPNVRFFKTLRRGAASPSRTGVTREGACAFRQKTKGRAHFMHAAFGNLRFCA